MPSGLFRKKPIHSVKIDHNEEHHLHKVLNVRDLTALGIAAIVGAGIFSTIGTAAYEGGPGVIFLFIFTAIACSFAAFCYAEFASILPVAGSAYTYAYVSFGELVAWIIGWALIMEYSVGNITVAISWSDYLCGFLSNLNIHVPMWMQMDWFTAHKGFEEASASIQSGNATSALPENLRDALEAYNTAPRLGSFHLVADLPALLIIILITWLVYIGIRESRNASNMMVLVKLSVVLLVILVGAFYVNSDHWSPFVPNGVGGILKGVSAVFFAYIGFDAISTTAEECQNPQRDLPRGMMFSIIICTALYVIVALVLTGMVSYKELNVGDPLAHVFEKLHLTWLSGIVALSAIFAMASVLLVFQIGQPRIWMSMSRDGLLPSVFSRLHPKFKTPSFSTIVTGMVVAIPALFLNLTTVTDLCSIGTLFAFVLVCGGLLIIHHRHSDLPASRYRTPYINARYFLPVIIATISFGIYRYEPDAVQRFLSNQKEIIDVDEVIRQCDSTQVQNLSNFSMYYHGKEWVAAGGSLQSYLKSLSTEEFKKTFKKYGISYPSRMAYDANLFYNKIPMWIWLCCLAVILVLSIVYGLSLIPVLGVLCCLYMMAQIPLHNWIGFSVWLVVGLVIYFSYGWRNSRLSKSA
ncbi:MAG: amino acid permease [Saprospiraceae bacterium]|nr:amino acid permease [Saprospiraceae bacterium]HMW38315.1 amino acid permease [Saprospiraceae bacterium]HMX88156.1 amino acid permease [Saprospiraceae bacterium]HMZ39895.1 amino acid permease [Saprospiraceae bacterium]HNA63979.1 amino acid permease [Saprospiraceae bacterium]